MPSTVWSDDLVPYGEAEIVESDLSLSGMMLVEPRLENRHSTPIHFYDSAILVADGMARTSSRTDRQHTGRQNGKVAFVHTVAQLVWI